MEMATVFLKLRAWLVSICTKYSLVVRGFLVACYVKRVEVVYDYSQLL